ncbi:hypothetical protein [Guptibacillus hwajinpoensis]|uniref:hypothetical protein n=1 Tax=Guptibacillus hwajinpoensis TaxID=208199 RepID=UPI00137934ED|nr:hypothetical protein [Alkalihalobacillus macyae]
MSNVSADANRVIHILKEKLGDAHQENAILMAVLEQKEEELRLERQEKEQSSKEREK